LFTHTRGRPARVYDERRSAAQAHARGRLVCPWTAATPPRRRSAGAAPAGVPTDGGGGDGGTTDGDGDEEPTVTRVQIVLQEANFPIEAANVPIEAANDPIEATAPAVDAGATVATDDDASSPAAGGGAAPSPPSSRVLAALEVRAGRLLATAKRRHPYAPRRHSRARGARGAHETIQGADS